MSATPALALEGVSKRFVKNLDVAERVANLLGARRRPQVVHAVDHVTLRVAKGTVVGLVGESGCGKSTLARIAAGIIEPTAGSVLIEGRDRAKLDRATRRRADLAVQLVFQDAMASLNPRMRAGAIIGEAPAVHGLVAGPDLESYVAAAMRQVGLDPATRDRFPHQFSGGQRTRIGIARALAVRPSVLICDEATAALDVSVQAQILNLCADLQRELGLTLLFVSHDLGVVEHISTQVCVMYLGRIVEEAATDAIFTRANHPYTQALLAGVPRLEARKRAFSALKGELPSPLAPPPGCHFHPRCPHAFARCRIERPALLEVAPGQRSACHLNEEPARRREARTLSPAA